jgi:hypothetical protein
MLLNREEMLNELRQGVILVNFTKADGSKRDMRCTLNPTILEKEMETYTPAYEQRSANDSDLSVSVWDMDKSDWRAFRLDRVNHVFNPAP